MSEAPLEVQGVSDADLAAETRAIAKIKTVPNPPIEGVAVTLCGTPAVVPPLKAKQLRKFSAQLEQIRKANDDMLLGDFMDIAVPVLHAALTRNYPTLTLDDCFELIDAENIKGALSGMLARSGYRERKAGE